MSYTVLAQLAALKVASAPVLKARWRELFDTEPPEYNRRLLENRLAYRIQELAYGGLGRETIDRLQAVSKQLSHDKAARGAKPMLRPVTGTKLIREWEGVEHCVTVRREDFEYLGQPFKSLSAVARAITGTQWEWLGFLWPQKSIERQMTQRRSSKGAAYVETPAVRKQRCAVYTRKSSEEGLDMDFNSLDAQREACEIFIARHEAEGWTLAADRYDDGGISGGTLERPGLKRLMIDIERGLVDVVVVYKYDRISRSLMDCLKLIEELDKKGATFVSVTQPLNTTTSAGRLSLNMLLSVAQFEREQVSERIRDKFAASRKRGIWMGGWTPFGYVVRDRKLIIDETDAERVRSIFRRFVQLKSTTRLARELVAAGERNKYGHLLDKSVLHRLLNNRVYIGEAVHKGTAYPGEHQPIIDRKLWDRVHSISKESPRARANATRAQTPALLKGLLYGPDGAAMSPTHTRKSGRLYRYYISQSVVKRGEKDHPFRSVPAGEIEHIVLEQVRQLVRAPEVIVQTWRAMKNQHPDFRENDVRAALVGFDELWNELFPAEQARIVQLLVRRVDILGNRLDITLKIEGLTSLAAELKPTPFQQAAE